MATMVSVIKFMIVTDGSFQAETDARPFERERQMRSFFSSIFDTLAQLVTINSTTSHDPEPAAPRSTGLCCRKAWE